MTNGDDDEPEKPKLKLVTESSGGESNGGDSGSNNVVGIGYSGEEPEGQDEDDEQIENIFDHSRQSFSITYGLQRQDILDVMENLSPRERRILELRFGLKDGKTRKLEEVALIFGLTRERVRQLEAKALRQLRHPNRNLRSSIGTKPSSPLSNLSWSDIQDKLSHFKSLDRRILKIFWGLSDEPSHSISEVAEKFNVTSEYVFELDKQARKLFE